MPLYQIRPATKKEIEGLDWPQKPINIDLTFTQAPRSRVPATLREQMRAENIKVMTTILRASETRGVCSITYKGPDARRETSLIKSRLWSFLKEIGLSLQTRRMPETTHSDGQTRLQTFMRPYSKKDTDL